MRTWLLHAWLFLLFTSFMTGPVFTADTARTAGAPPQSSRQEDNAKQEEEEEEEEEQGDKENAPAPRPPSKAGPSEREKKILALFNAGQKYFQDGKVVLVYSFQDSQDTAQLEDWRPTLEEAKPRIRWAGPQEVPEDRKSYTGYTSTVRRYLSGIMIGDRGLWLHRAIFLPDVAVEMSCLSLAQPRAGTVMGPVFYSEKKKRAMGASAGGQLVCVQGARPAHARAPHPAKDKPVAYDSRINLGMAFDGKVLSGFRESRKFADSKEAPRLCEGIDTGRAAVAWNGSVQALVFSVRIEGKLDPDWIARELGEKGGVGKEDSAKK